MIWFVPCLCLYPEPHRPAGPIKTEAQIMAEHHSFMVSAMTSFAGFYLTGAVFSPYPDIAEECLKKYLGLQHQLLEYQLTRALESIK